MDKGSRKRLRFPAEPGTLAWIDLVVRENRQDFNPTIPALVVDEALNGCCLIVLYEVDIMEGARCTVQVADLDPVVAEIRWISDLDENVLKVGMMFFNTE